MCGVLEGWLYLAGVKDVFNGELVGYAMAEHMATALVTQALFRAVVARRPPPGLIHHADRGRQYGSQDDPALLKPFGLQPSMSRQGDCWDHAPMASFWGTLKTERVYLCRVIKREQTRRVITEYIEIFYNRVRKPVRLDLLSVNGTMPTA